MTFEEAKPFVAAVARHGFTALAGALVSAGAIDPNQTGQFIGIASGIAIWGASVAWSWFQKRNQAKAVVTAAVTGNITPLNKG